MKDIQWGTMRLITEFDVSMVNYNADVPEEVFSSGLLQKACAHYDRHTVPMDQGEIVGLLKCVHFMSCSSGTFLL